MNPDKQRAAAAKGGRNVPAAKRTFARDPDLASRAGSKGGLASIPPKRPSRQAD
ncbi:hypothetical protein FS320_36210 [Microvirga tunisiensis]|uniref:Stress-induced protein n=2 Tax=Microvirga tunisiensis TaxID=2108360 RepID=A0A5N7N458_9HYPH|nr:KGG domain-containing protein [Microvirga tunisiensis]MPR12246.1 hypothetical protein [Microvirga tunisiensis]MPR30336.1 hypothetical protein [Microvirga tunisiensis]